MRSTRRSGHDENATKNQMSAVQLKLSFGQRLHRAGRLDQAVDMYRAALEIAPGHAETLRWLGLAALHAGNPREADRHYVASLRSDPDRAPVLSEHAAVLAALERIEEAIAALDRALTLQPDDASAWGRLGDLLRGREMTERAAAAYRELVRLAPDLAEAHNNLGNMLDALERSGEALEAYGKAIEIRPDYAEAHYNLANVLHHQGRIGDALRAFKRAIEIKPDFVEAIYNRANTLKESARYEEAAVEYRRALDGKPGWAEALMNLGNVKLDQGDYDAAMAAYREVRKQSPDYAAAHSNLIFCMNYDPRYGAEEIFAESRRWNAAHAGPFQIPAHDASADRDAERRLRVGYFSPDFRSHSVSYFFEALLDAHDRSRVEVICYAEVRKPDDVTARLRAGADGWRSTIGVGDDDLADMVRRDRIDIFVDLAGHTQGNRLGAFARCPAPVQIAWLGYPNTTGLDAIGYRLTDDIADPDGAGRVHSETLIRLPRGFLCYRPPDDAPAVAAAAARPITFGSFNNLSKVRPNVIAVWAQILNRVPDARLLVKSAQLANAERARYLRDAFVAHGVEGSRIETTGQIESKSGHLDAYRRLDIALDPFPYNGTTTTFEALWMGVPVITLAGDRHAARVGASILRRLGLDDYVVNDEQAYVDAAVALAGDASRRADLRGTLRETLAASPLCDAAGFARDVEAAYRRVWRHWCADDS